MSNGLKTFWLNYILSEENGSGVLFFFFKSHYGMLNLIGLMNNLPL